MPTSAIIASKWSASGSSKKTHLKNGACSCGAPRNPTMTVPIARTTSGPAMLGGDSCGWP